MNVNLDKLIKGIEIIVRQKKIAVDILADHFGIKRENIFYKYMMDEIDHSGVTEEGVKFMFHGYGCSIIDSKSDSRVEIEFGPEGNCLVFDKNTLAHCLEFSIAESEGLSSFLLSNGVIEIANENLFQKVKSGNNSWESVREDIDSCVSDRYIFKPKALRN